MCFGFSNKSFTIYKKGIRGYFLAFASIAVLFTSYGFVDFHVSRTADHDAALVLFTSLAVFSFYKWIHQDDNKHLWWMTLWLLCGFFTKSFMGWLFLPAFVAYAFIHKKGIAILKNKQTYFSLGILLGSVTTYYVYMHSQFPDFINGITGHALGRYTKVVDNHVWPWDYYLNLLLDKYFQPWIYFVPIGIAVAVKRTGRTAVNNFALLALLACLSQMIIMSCSASKLYWYIASCYPMLAFLAAVGIYVIYQLIEKWFTNIEWLEAKTMASLVLVLLFFFPYKAMFEKIDFPSHYDKSSHYAYLMKDIRKRQFSEDYIIFTHEQPQASFYAYHSNTYRGTKIKVSTGNFKQLKAKDYFIAVFEEDIEKIKTLYEIKQLAMNKKARYFQVLSKK